MNAVKLLKQDHRQVADLLDQFENADMSEKCEIAERVCRLLTVHAQIEEELFYPAAREVFEGKDLELVDEAEVEHASVKDFIAQIQGSNENQDELWSAKVKVMGEYVKHHVKEEETELFPKVQKTDLDLDDLGRQLAERKMELLSALGEGAAADEEQTSKRSRSSSRSRGGGRSERRTSTRVGRGSTRVH